MNNKTQEALKMAIETMKWLRMRSPIIYEELEAEKACIEALEHEQSFAEKAAQMSFMGLWDAYTTLKMKLEVLEQPAQEPVEFTITGKLGDRCSFKSTEIKKGDKVYTNPAPSWHSLSDDEIVARVFDNDELLNRILYLDGVSKGLKQAIKGKESWGIEAD